MGNQTPDRLVGYAQAVLENARRDARDRDRLQQSQSTVRPASPDEAGTVSGEYPASSQDTDASFSPAGPGKEACTLWQAALSELELQMTKATFSTWLKPARLLAWESNGDSDVRTRVVLGTPNEYVKDWLENRLYTPIRRTLSGITGNSVEIEFEVRDQFVEQGLPLLNR